MQNGFCRNHYSPLFTPDGVCPDNVHPNGMPNNTQPTIHPQPHRVPMPPCCNSHSYSSERKRHRGVRVVDRVETDGRRATRGLAVPVRPRIRASAPHTVEDSGSRGPSAPRAAPPPPAKPPAGIRQKQEIRALSCMGSNPIGTPQPN